MMMKNLKVRTSCVTLSLLLLAGCQGGGEDDADGEGNAPVSRAELARTQQSQKEHGQARGESSPGSVATGELRTVLEYPNAVELLPGVWGGGQPTREQLQAAAEAGVRTVVNLRLMTEEGAWDEREFVEKLGMRYIHMPVAGPAGVSQSNAGVLAGITEDEGNHPVMLHCASGRRINALVALIEEQKKS